MKTRTYLFAVAAALAGMLAFSGSGLAAPGGGSGGGGGGGGGGDMEPPDFGDLIILYRDADGVPYLTADSCQQPLPSDTCVTTPPVGCTLAAGAPGPGVLVVPVDGDTCGVLAECATCTQEVEFGRTNVVRAPASVFEQQLTDVVINLATADCTTLDPAGRMVAIRAGETPGNNLVSTIDSPLQNLAIYRQLMLTGSIGIPLPRSADSLDTAARGLGVASDKTGEVNVDQVAYLNQIMGLSDPATPTIHGKICIDVKEEVKGVVQLVQKCFLNYGSGPSDFPPEGASYTYNRGNNFGVLPSPAYIPEVSSNDGWFEYLALVPGSEADPRFQILQDLITTTVFAGEPGFTEGNIGGFAQAADDTRAVINFMHDWPMPDADVYGTPVPCDADPGLIAYDVLISEESGLQVPAQMVDGHEEGREFTVTVANASGSSDPASGTVTVTAIPDAGGSIAGSPWVFDFTDLQPGTSDDWTTVFTIDLGQRTTIRWTAVAAAPKDVNPANNTMTATTSVKVTGGGGGGGKP